MEASPKTLIICIGTHGAMLTETDTEFQVRKPVYRKLVHPINIYKINATSFGIPFLSSINNFQNICCELERVIECTNTEKKRPNDITKTLQKICIETNRENTEDIIYESLYMDPNHTINLKQYANYSHQMFNIIKIKQHEEYIEKLYTRFSNRDIKEYRLEEDYNFFNEIKLVNMKGVNLFEFCQINNNKIHAISLSNLIDLLYNMIPIKNLIIIDLTCSVTNDDMRNDRRIRRNLSKCKKI